MTNHDAGLLTFRALAAYAGIRALDVSGNFIGLSVYSKEPMSSGMVFAELFIPPLLMFVCAGFLWFSAPFLTKKVFAGSSEIEGIPATLADIKALVFSAIGLALLVLTIPDVIKTFFLVYATTAFAKYDDEIISQRNFRICLTLIKVLIGFWLFFGNSGLKKFLNKLRRE